MKMYKIAIVTDEQSWIKPYIERLERDLRSMGHTVVCRYDFDTENSYDFVFLLSYQEIIKKEWLCLNRHNLVVHESDLPQGKGWSPLTWQILEGKSQITITLFEADEHVDAGKIYLQKKMCFDGTELIDELRRVQGETTHALCTAFVQDYPDILRTARKQVGEESFYPRRRAKDSRLDLDRTIREQINLFRVVDNDRYPAFFEWMGYRYYLKVSREKEDLL